jgi:uncharacterized protein (TIGR03435 family)
MISAPPFQNTQMAKRRNINCTGRICSEAHLLKRRSVVTSGSIGIILVASAAAAFSQYPSPRAEFEVASMKALRDAPPTAQMSGDISHGKLTLNNAPLRQIIAVAWTVQGTNVEGGPTWLNTERYQIEAKAENADTSEAQVRIMLQTLLEDRCHLKLHRESRLLRRYTLMAARGGPKLQKAGHEEKDNCALNLDSPKKELACQKSPILGLANALSNLLQSPVVDETGLSEFYNFTLSWEGDDILSAVPDAMERLGLKLEMKKVPTEVLVIDGVERPSGN